MATTREFTLTEEWTACATGAGDVCLTAVAEARWIITDSAETPTLTSGHWGRCYGAAQPIRDGRLRAW